MLTVFFAPRGREKQYYAQTMTTCTSARVNTLTCDVEAVRGNFQAKPAPEGDIVHLRFAFISTNTRYPAQENQGGLMAIAIMFRRD